MEIKIFVITISCNNTLFIIIHFNVDFDYIKELIGKSLIYQEIYQEIGLYYDICIYMRIFLFHVCLIKLTINGLIFNIYITIEKKYTK